MILIADSGSTKTDWRAVSEDGKVKGYSTAGINPVFMGPDEISGIVSGRLLPDLEGKVDEIRFYGAGVISKEVSGNVCAALKNVFPGAECYAESDLLGAARAICGFSSGIACIIGTGSNSCLYDGKEIVKNVRAGGYILGDEASGAYFGRRFLSDFVKGLLPQAIEKEFAARYSLDYPSVVQKVYKEPMANRYMASFMPFLHEFLNHPYVKNLLRTGFEEFIARNVAQYDGCRYLEVGFTGSVAFYFKDILLKVLEDARIKPGRIVRTPMDGLIQFHKNSL